MIHTQANPHGKLWQAITAAPYGKLLLLLMADANAVISLPQEMQTRVK